MAIPKASSAKGAKLKEHKSDSTTTTRIGGGSARAVEFVPGPIVNGQQSFELRVSEPSGRSR